MSITGYRLYTLIFITITRVIKATEEPGNSTAHEGWFDFFRDETSKGYEKLVDTLSTFVKTILNEISTFVGDVFFPRTLDGRTAIEFSPGNCIVIGFALLAVVMSVICLFSILCSWPRKGLDLRLATRMCYGVILLNLIATMGIFFVIGEQSYNAPIIAPGDRCPFTLHHLNLILLTLTVSVISTAKSTKGALIHGFVPKRKFVILEILLSCFTITGSFMSLVVRDPRTFWIIPLVSISCIILSMACYYIYLYLRPAVYFKPEKSDNKPTKGIKGMTASPRMFEEITAKGKMSSNH